MDFSLILFLLTFLFLLLLTFVPGPSDYSFFCIEPKIFGDYSSFYLLFFFLIRFIWRLCLQFCRKYMKFIAMKQLEAGEILMIFNFYTALLTFI